MASEYAGGFLAVGGILDTIGNVQDLISVQSASILTIITLFFWGLIEYAVSKTPQEWMTKNNKRVWIVKLGKGVRYPIIGALLALWLPHFFTQNLLRPTEQVRKGNQPIFLPDDSTSFNVLIIRFEDYIANEDTYCIGRSIQENLNVLQANEDLPLLLRTYYADTIPPPNSLKEAIAIQKQHHADLIIYGLAKNVLENCEGAEVCFRYNISQSVVAQIAPIIDAKRTRHDLDYTKTSPMAIEKDILQIDALSLKHWITSLVNVKANKQDEAFLELDAIGNNLNLSDTARSKIFLNIGMTYSSLQQYLKAVKAYSRAILLDSDFAITYYNRGNAFLNLKQYERAIKDYDKAILLNPDFAMGYNNRGNVFFYLKQYEQAIKDYGTALLLYPDDGIAYNNRGLAHVNLKQYERAIKDYDKAIQLDSDDTKAYNNRGASQNVA